MRKFLLWLFIPFLIISAAAIVLIPVIRKDAGYILISVGGYVVEMRFWMACVLIAAVIFFLWFMLSLIRGTLRLGGRAIRWWPSKSEKLIQQRQERAMQALWDGNMREAHRNLLRVAKTSSQKNNPAALINAANSAVAIGYFEEAETLLSNIDDKYGDEVKVDKLLCRARLLKKQGHLYEAQKIIDQSLTIFPLHESALRLQVEIQTALSEWQSLASLIPRLRKAKAFSEEEIAALEFKTHLQLLAVVSNIKDLEATWNNIPKDCKKMPEIIASYAEHQLKLGADDQAADWLFRALKKEFRDDLVLLLSYAEVSDPAVQLQKAEKFLKHHEDNSALHLALARIAIRNEQLDKAKAHFERSIELYPRAAAFSELASLLAKMGEHERSADIFQKSLRLTAPSGVNHPLQPAQ